MKLKRHLVLMVLAGFCALFFSCGGNSGGAEQSQKVKSYDVGTLRLSSTMLFEEYPAVLQGEQEVEIRSKIDGYIEHIYVDEGAAVKKGQLLMKIFSPQYQQELRTAEAGIETAQAEVKTAAMEVQKVRPLVEKEIISSYSLDAAQYALQSRTAALNQAKAALANAKANIGYTAITSPATGIIGKLPYKTGSLVSSTSPSPLTTVVSSGNINSYFSLNEKQLLSISRTYKGSTLQEKLKNIPAVSFVLSDGTLYDQSGKIETASGLVSTETGSIDFRASFPNPAHLLRSGASGKIRILHPAENVFVVPQKATYDLQGKRFVYVVQQDKTVKSTAIAAQPTPDGQSFVVEKGLKKGDKIVLEGTSELKDGMKIAPHEI